MKEQAIQKKIINYCRSRGAVVYNITQAYPNGCPDLLVCYRGHFIGIEVKRPETKSKVTALQQLNLSKIKKAQGHSLVAYNLEPVEELLNCLSAS